MTHISNALTIRKFPFGQGGGGFTLASLGLSVDLLMNESETTANALKYLGDMSLDASHTPDASSMVDRSAAKAILSTKASDFSVDEDGITSGDFTFTADQTINSEGGFLKCIFPTGTGQIAMSLPNGYLLGTNGLTMLRLKYRWAWGQNDTTVGQFYQYFPIARRDFLSPDWAYGVTYDTEIFVVQNSIKNFGMAGGSVDRLGKSLMIKDIITEEIDGNHFLNVTSAQMPHRNFTDYTLDFDGIAQHFANSANFATAVSSDQAGMFTLVFRDDEGAGQVCQIFDINDGGLTNYLTIRLDSSNNIRVYTVGASVSTNNANFGPITAMRGGWIMLQIGSTGSAYKVYANGVEQSLVSGTDNGQWMGDLSGLTTSWIARGHTGSYGAQYGAIGLRHFGYKSGQVLTAQQQSDTNDSPEYQQIYTP